MRIDFVFIHYAVIEPLYFFEFQIGIDVCNGQLTTVTQCKSKKDKNDKMRQDKYAMSLDLNTPCVVENLDCKNGNESACSLYQIRFQCAVSKGENEYNDYRHKTNTIHLYISKTFIVFVIKPSKK